MPASAARRTIPRQAISPAAHLLHVAIARGVGEAQGVEAEVPEQLVTIVGTRQVLQGRPSVRHRVR